MITQNVDNDILVLNYKDTLETIDKSHNIQFIYHLYNLFKTSINKYKDFRKVIQSKKEVYEKLLFNCKNNDANDVNDIVILQLEEELSILNNEKILRVKECNAINIDISNPSYLSIVDIDYTSLINDIVANKANIIVPNDIYLTYKEMLNYYKYSLNDVPDIQKLVNLYTQHLEEEFNKLPSMNKPCEISYIHNEERELSEYINDNDNDIENNNDNDNDEELFCLRDELLKNKRVLGELISNKPAKVSLQYPSKNIDKLMTVIIRIYGNIEAFNEFISSNTKPSFIDKNILKKIRESITNPITFEYYNDAICSRETIKNEIKHIKEVLASLEKEFNNLFLKQQKINNVNMRHYNL